MSTVPTSNLGRIEFYENHIAPWTQNVTAIGLEGQQIVDLNTLTVAARDAYTAAQMARQASKDATAALYEAVNAMHGGPGAGADMIRDIRNFAQSTDDPNVYILASIPAPAEPAPVGPPGRPSNFTVGLDIATGAVVLGWKCDNPAGASGTVYQVERKIGGSGEYTKLDTVGEKAFTDDTLPATAASASGGVFYRITGIRSTLRGSAATVNVVFGVGGEVSAVSSSAGAETVAVKMAA